MTQSPHTVPTSKLFSLQDRTILVTGGLGGIGAPLVHSILESGGDVICFDLPTSPDLTSIYSLASKTGTEFHYYSVNVTNEKSVSETVEKGVDGLRYPLRGVVTCAGTSDERDAIDYTADLFKKVYEINVLGTFLVVKAAAKVMIREKSGGSVVLVASMSGSVANKGVNTSAYNTSKSAVLQLARSLAAEWGSLPSSPPIRVNSISPGYIYTPLSAEALAKPEIKKIWTEGNMLGRISHPEEYRAPILFLLGDGSSFVTGMDLKSDGGHTAW